MVAGSELAQEAPKGSKEKEKENNSKSRNNNNNDDGASTKTAQAATFSTSSLATKQPSTDSLNNINSRAGGKEPNSSGNQVGSNQQHPTDNSSQQASSTNKSKKTNITEDRKSLLQDMSDNANQQHSVVNAVECNGVTFKKTSPNASKNVKEEKLSKKQMKKNKKQKNNKKKDLVNKGRSKDGNANAADDDVDGTKDTNNVNCRREANKSLIVANVDQKQKSLVDELKLFQNNQLLNQQDPIQQLQIQLSQMNKGADDENNNHHSHIASSAVRQSTPMQHQQNAIDNLQTSKLQQQQLQTTNNDPCQQLAAIGDQPPKLLGSSQFVVGVQYGNEENIFTVKKGVLWQQQQYDKFHQRLFSRWKKRYFILTTDYLVCFKRSTPKVGRSEMGKFLYKVSYLDSYL